MKAILYILIALVFIFGLSTVKFLNSHQQFAEEISITPTSTPSSPLSVNGIYQAVNVATPMHIVLSQNHMAIVATNYKNGKPPFIETGTWAQTSDTVTLNLTAKGNEPYTSPKILTFQKNDTNLKLNDILFAKIQ